MLRWVTMFINENREKWKIEEEIRQAQIYIEIDEWEKMSRLEKITHLKKKWKKEKEPKEENDEKKETKKDEKKDGETWKVWRERENKSTKNTEIHTFEDSHEVEEIEKIEYKITIKSPVISNENKNEKEIFKNIPPKEEKNINIVTLKPPKKDQNPKKKDKKTKEKQQKINKNDRKLTKITALFKPKEKTTLLEDNLKYEDDHVECSTTDDVTDGQLVMQIEKTTHLEDNPKYEDSHVEYSNTDDVTDGQLVMQVEAANPAPSTHTDTTTTQCSNYSDISPVPDLEVISDDSKSSLSPAWCNNLDQRINRFLT